MLQFKSLVLRGLLLEDLRRNKRRLSHSKAKYKKTLLAEKSPSCMELYSWEDHQTKWEVSSKPSLITRGYISQFSTNIPLHFFKSPLYTHYTTISVYHTPLYNLTHNPITSQIIAVATYVPFYSQFMIVKTC